jgi:16S rRNA (uracil1498-N3)-methyltransferase
VQVPRFLVEQPLAVQTRIKLPAAVAHHAHTVLRLREGDSIVLFNGQGGEFRARLVRTPGAGASALHADLLEFDPVEREARIRITLIQALTTSDKIDWVIEKAVEIGIARVIVAGAARSAVRLEPARRERRLQHWRELANAACSQCGRNRLVSIASVGTLAEALHEARDAQLKWVLDPAAPQGLPPASPQARSTALAIGPEGGFDPGEMRLAAQSGFAPTWLGPRVLRTETAGLAAAAAWLAVNGEFSEQRG